MRIGIDLGGTKIEGIVLDHHGSQVYRQRIAAPQGGYQQTLSAIRALVEDMDHFTGERRNLGIATPGSLSSGNGLMRNSNSVWLNGQPLLADLTHILQRPVRIANDADCFTLSEASDGAARGYRNVFGVILGTGVGGGIVIDGKLLQGANQIAGEWGHNPLPDPRDDERPGPPCYCGKTGCIETFLSGPGMSASHRRNFGDNLSAQQIALADNAQTKNTLNDYMDRLARALAGVINMLDPDCIVLGGGLSNIASIYEQLPKLWAAHVFSETVKTVVLPPKYGDSSGVRGAAWLWEG